MGQYVKNPLGLVLVANDPAVLLSLEPRIKSSLDVEHVNFKPYTLDEMRDILQERVKDAFRAGVVAEGVVLLAANHAVRKGSDVRVGLECLFKAGRLAEQENSSKVLVKHVKQVLQQVRKAKPQILRARLGRTSQEILSILDEFKELKSTELYKLYKERSKAPVANRTFRARLAELEKVGLIRIKRKRLKERLISKSY